MVNSDREVVYLGAARCFTGKGCGMVGNHPLFKLMKYPPKGYRYVMPEMLEEEKREILLKNATGESLTPEEKTAQRIMEFREKELENEMEKFTEYCRSNEISRELYERYFRIVNTDRRGIQIPIRENTLSFLPGFLFCIQNTPWIVEIEDVVTLFFPFIENGKQPGGKELKDMEAYRFTKYMLQKEACIGVIAHVKSTVDTYRALFPDTEIANKISYIPMCHENVPAGDICRTYQKSLGKKVRLFFSSSWANSNFNVRGGLDVLASFDKLCRKYDNVELILKCAVPEDMPKKCHDIMRRYKDRIHVIDEQLAESEMAALMKNMDIFLLPSARVHIISILRAMATGLPVVASDGWGISEYIQDGVNGSIVAGRYGKTSWIDEEGMLREDYSVLKEVDEAFAESLAEKIEQIISDEKYRFRITKNAMNDISTRFSVENWNRELEEVFGKCYEVIDSRGRADREQIIKRQGAEEYGA